MGDRWVDWITLLTPYAVVGSALAALRAAGADRRAWTVALVGACSYVQGHGINVAANSIGNARGDGAPVHLWDEVVGHWLWYLGVALLVVALARAVDVAATPIALALAVASGLTWTTNALEGTTAVGSPRRRGRPRRVGLAAAQRGHRTALAGRLRHQRCGADGVRGVAPGLPGAERARGVAAARTCP